MLDQVSDVAMVIDRNRRLVLANQTSREMAGGRDPVVEGMTCHQLSHHRETPCQGPSEECPLTKVIQTKAPLTVLHTRHDAHGNAMRVETNATPIFDAAGEVVEIIETCRKIGEPPEAERHNVIDEIRASLARFQAAVRVAERALFEAALKANDGNKTTAAASLGMKASTFRAKPTKHGLWSRGGRRPWKKNSRRNRRSVTGRHQATFRPF